LHPALHPFPTRRSSDLLNHVLLSQRLQFLHKLSTLEEMVEELGKEFRHAADDLAEGISLHPMKMWAEVDAHHYDLNTCLREAIRSEEHTSELQSPDHLV